MSRLTSIIILSFLLLGITCSTGQSQSPNESLGLSKKEYKAIRKRVRKTSFTDRLLAFDLETQTLVSLANLDTVYEVSRYPLPSAQALSRTELTYPDFLADVLDVNYFFRLDNHRAQFYGLDSIGRVLKVTPYEADSLLAKAILEHDYLLSGKTKLSQWVAGVKASKSFVKQINEKLIKAYTLQEELPKINIAGDELKQAYRNWTIRVYGANKQIHRLKNSPNSLLVDKRFPPDNNWLSELITEQIKLENFNKEGRRTRLADGSPRLFDLDTSAWGNVDTLIAKAISNEVMPGCQLLVAKDGYVFLEKAFGYQTYDSLIEVTTGTLYDLASLTKVLATTQALMLLYEDGQFDPELRLSEYLPYLNGTNKATITGSEVLSHQADLYLYYPFWKKARDNFKLADMQKGKRAGSRLVIEPWVGDSIVHWAAESALLSERLDTITRRQYFYSDVGFFFLKELIEKQSGTSLDSFLMKDLYQQNQLKLVFNPLNFYPDSLIAPTEFDKLLRNELVRGYVHDRNAALLGGVAGQAGLFGNARNIANLMQIHLDQGQRNEKQIFSSSTIEAFASRHFPGNRRGWGWDMPGSEPDGPVSEYVSEGTFGHTGFTGGMVWADPKENLIFVFLSNRVYPSADNNKLIEMNIRTRIQDLIYRSLGYQ